MTRLINADRLKKSFEANTPIAFQDCVPGIHSVIDLEPTVDAEPVIHGKWIYGNDFHWYTASCSACGYQRRTDIKATGWNQWKYCPNCGAKMDERKEE